MARKKKEAGAGGIGGGSKLSRSEILQARINSKQRLALEIMARLERRTVSSFIEGLIEKAAKEMEVDMIPPDKAPVSLLLPMPQPAPEHVTVEKAVRTIWHVDDAARFVAFAIAFPDLLSDYEEKLWLLIRSEPHFWAHYRIQHQDNDAATTRERWWPINEYAGIVQENLQKAWPLLKEIAEGKKPLNDLVDFGRTQLKPKAVTKPKHFPGLIITSRGEQHERKV